MQITITAEVPDHATDPKGNHTLGEAWERYEDALERLDDALSDLGYTNIRIDSRD